MERRRALGCCKEDRQVERSAHYGEEPYERDEPAHVLHGRTGVHQRVQTILIGRSLVRRPYEI